MCAFIEIEILKFLSYNIYLRPKITPVKEGCHYILCIYIYLSCII